MKQVVYVDVLLVLNLIINYFILLSTALFLKIEKKRIRILLGSFLGSLYSLIIFLPEMPAFFSVLSKMAAGLIIVLASFGYKSYKRFIKIFAVFMFITFVFAGLMIALWFAFKPNGMVYKNNSVYFDFSPLVLIVSTAVCYVLVTLITKLINRRSGAALLYDIELTVFGNTVCGRGMLDTGNNLRETFTGFPVAICTYAFVEKIIPAELKAFFQGHIESISDIEDESWQKRVRLISYSTIKDMGLLPSFRPDKLTVKSVQSGFDLTEVYIAVTGKSKKLNDHFDMIISPEIAERNEEINAKICQSIIHENKTSGSKN